MGKARKKQNMRGFTLMEVLIVVAIIAILTALTLPGLLKSWQNMKLTELDDDARQIFLTAQNEMTNWKASGELTLLSTENTGRLSVNDLHADGDGNYELTSADAETCGFDQTTLLLGTMGGSYLLKIHPATGDVVEVYYSKGDVESAAASMRAEPDFQADDVSAYANESIRAKAGVGYYGGSDLSAQSSDVKNATLEFINGDDLYIKLTVRGVKDPSTVQMTVTLTDQDQDQNREIASWTQDSFTPGGSRFYKSTVPNGTRYTCTYYILVDSLQSTNTTYANLIGNNTGMYGDNLTVSVESGGAKNTLFADGEARSVIFDKDKTTQNSMYQSLTTASVAGVTTLNIEVASARHLYNLDLSDDKINNANETVNVSLTKDLDFAEYCGKQALDSENATLTVQHPDSLKTAFLTNCKYFTLDGGGHELRNFSWDGGMLASNATTDQTMTVQDLAVVNPRITPYSGTNGGVKGAAGTLIAFANPRTISEQTKTLNLTLNLTNCRVWLEKEDGTELDAAFLSTHAVSGTTSVGGLVGYSYGPLNIENSFAAVPVSATGTTAQNAGGLVGFCKGALNLSNCYTSCAVTASFASANAGGLAGSLTGGDTIENCYSTSDVAVGKSGTAGTLVGSASGSTALTTCTAYGTVTRGTGDTAVSTYGPMTGSGTATYTDCQYLLQSGNQDVTDGEPNADATKPEGREYSALMKRGGNPPASSHPYGTPPENHPVFPFPLLTYQEKDENNQTVTVTLPHYGNWPAEIVSIAAPYGLCYYEQYAGGTWGFYGYDKAGDLVDTLDYENKYTIQDAGYAVATADNQTAKAPHVDTWLYAKLAAEPIMVENNQIRLYALQDASQTFPTYGSSCYGNGIKDEQSGRTIYFNPNCAASLSLKTYSSSEESPLQIRTESQLLAMFPAYNLFMKQTHNIEAKSAETGKIEANYVFTYDGGNNAISGLRQPLFKTFSGTLKNIVLKDVDITGDGVAPLVMTVSGGTISGCRVSGTVQDTDAGNQNVAGFIYSNNSAKTIQNCISTCSVISKNGTAAGFLHESTGGTISNCAFQGTVEVNQGNGSAAGFAYTANGGSFTNCYVSGSVKNSSNGAAAGFVSLPGSISYTHCYVNAAITGKTTDGFAGSSTGTYTECFSTQATPRSKVSRVASIDWSEAVDVNGIPNGEWPAKIKTTN